MICKNGTLYVSLFDIFFHDTLLISFRFLYHTFYFYISKLHVIKKNQRIIDTKALPCSLTGNGKLDIYWSTRMYCVKHVKVDTINSWNRAVFRINISIFEVNVFKKKKIITDWNLKQWHCPISTRQPSEDGTRFVFVSIKFTLCR